MESTIMCELLQLLEIRENEDIQHAHNLSNESLMKLTENVERTDSLQLLPFSEKNRNKITRALYILESFRNLVSSPGSFNTLSMHNKRIGYMVKFYKWPLKVGKLAIQLAKTLKGAELVHVGVVVFNTLHHYSGKGLQQQLEMPDNFIQDRYAGPSFFITKKTRNDFDHWIHDIADEYCAVNYNFRNQNCIDFAGRALDFLLDTEYEKDSQVEKLNQWLKMDKDWTVESVSNASKIYNRFVEEFGKVGGAVSISAGSGTSSIGHTLVKDDMDHCFGDIKSVHTFMQNAFFSSTGGIYDTESGEVHETRDGSSVRE